jgi:hypothetical protein
VLQGSGGPSSLAHVLSASSSAGGLGLASFGRPSRQNSSAVTQRPPSFGTNGGKGTRPQQAPRAAVLRPRVVPVGREQLRFEVLFFILVIYFFYLILIISKLLFIIILFYF